MKTCNPVAPSAACIPTAWSRSSACSGSARRHSEARLSGLPAGVSVEPGRIEVRFSGAKDAVGRLFALAQALTNDYERFEALVEEEDAASGGGEVQG